MFAGFGRLRCHDAPSPKAVSCSCGTLRTCAAPALDCQMSMGTIRKTKMQRTFIRGLLNRLSTSLFPIARSAKSQACYSHLGHTRAGDFSEPNGRNHAYGGA